MKGFLKKKWHRIPVALLTALLILVLAAGSVFAIYPFAKAKVEVTVAEAIVLGYNWCGYSWVEDDGDDLVPYMEPAGVVPDIILAQGGDGYDLDVTIQSDGDASEFCPGETLIIPLNLRNRSDGTITVDVTHGDDGELDVDFAVIGPGTNTGWVDSITGFTMAGHQGTFGSDMNGDSAQDDGSTCLYIKVHAPNECPSDTYTFGIDFSRS